MVFELILIPVQNPVSKKISGCENSTENMSKVRARSARGRISRMYFWKSEVSISWDFKEFKAKLKSFFLNFRYFLTGFPEVSLENLVKIRPNFEKKVISDLFLLKT